MLAHPNLINEHEPELPSLASETSNNEKHALRLTNQPGYIHIYTNPLTTAAAVERFRTAGYRKSGYFFGGYLGKTKCTLPHLSFMVFVS
jgi:tRNA(Phe) wybutosine-synthesizing methylase Tyw3